MILWFSTCPPFAAAIYQSEFYHPPLKFRERYSRFAYCKMRVFAPFLYTFSMVLSLNQPVKNNLLFLILILIWIRLVVCFTIIKNDFSRMTCSLWFFHTVVSRSHAHLFKELIPCQFFFNTSMNDHGSNFINIQVAILPQQGSYIHART